MPEAPSDRPPDLLRGRRWGAALAMVGLVLVALAVAVGTGALDGLDERVRDRFESDSSVVLDHANDFLHVVGSPIVFAAAVALGARLCWWRWRDGRTTTFAVASPVTAVVLAEHVLKATVAPTWPSGTVTAVTAVGTTALLLLRAATGAARLPAGSTAVAVAAVATTATCLILNSDHTASDIAGGVLLGLALPLGGALLHDRATGARRSAPRDDDGCRGSPARR